MRTHKDRLRHTILFEVILLAFVTPLLSCVLNRPMAHMGTMAVTLSLIAMLWNYVYNVLFDHALKQRGKPLYPRSAGLRVLHSTFFELGLLTVSIPMIMFWMKYRFLQALALDIFFVVMVLIYSFIFNWLYDHIFPVHIHTTEGNTAGANLQLQD